jgi:hypothetical protein
LNQIAFLGASHWGLLNAKLVAALELRDTRGNFVNRYNHEGQNVVCPTPNIMH